jgi:hypothetical protein
MALTGLVLDGGTVIAEYAQLTDVAENAARIGCQQIAGIRNGKPHLDASSAQSEILKYLNDRNIQGKVDVEDGGAQVSLTKTVPMKFLALIGIRERTVTVVRSARVVSG